MSATSAAQTRRTEDETTAVTVNFKTAFNECPDSLAGLEAGTIREGVFYPAGSVARHYFLRQRSALPARPKPDVYFIRSEHGGPVKIGVATDVWSRLASLQTAHPYTLKVIGLIHGGGRSVERELHRKFSSIRLNGEWFAWTQEMESYINGIN